MPSIHGTETSGQRAAPLRMAPAARSANDDILIAEPPALLPPGLYDAVGGHATVVRHSLFNNAHKLVVPWTIVLPDDESELGTRQVIVRRFYPLQPGPGGRVRAAPNGDLLREWCRITGRRPARLDRIPRNVFAGVLCEIAVVTVVKDFRQRLLPAAAQYSKVEQVLERKAGGSRL